MANELGLYALIKNIVAASMVMGGRFHVLRTGHDINSVNFGDIEKDVFDGYQAQQKWPCVLMMPPTESEPTNDRGWSTYHIQMSFLTLYRRTGDGAIKSANLQTNTSEHTKEMDWCDMRKCAGDFRKVFRQITRIPPVASSIREAAAETQYSRVTAKGNDNVNGITMSFSVAVFNGICDMADYGDPAAIVIPDFNPHPLHKQ